MTLTADDVRKCVVRDYSRSFRKTPRAVFRMTFYGGGDIEVELLFSGTDEARQLMVLKDEWRLATEEEIAEAVAERLRSSHPSWADWFNWPTKSRIIRK